MLPKVMIKGRLASCLEQVKRALFAQELTSFMGSFVHLIEVHGVLPDFEPPQGKACPSYDVQGPPWRESGSTWSLNSE